MISLGGSVSNIDPVLATWAHLVPTKIPDSEHERVSPR